MLSCSRNPIAGSGEIHVHSSEGGLWLPSSVLSSQIWKVVQSFSLALAPLFLNPIVSCLQDVFQYLSFPVFLNKTWGSEVSAGPVRSSNLYCSLGPNSSHNCQSYHDSAPCNNGVACHLHLPSFQSCWPISDTVLRNPAALSYLLILSFSAFPLPPQSSLYFLQHSDLLIISLFLDPIIN